MCTVSVTEAFFFIIMLLVVIWYINFYMKQKRLYELASKINGPPTIAILGNALKCVMSHDKMADALLESIEYYKSPTRFWFGPYLVLHLWDPKQLEIVFSAPCSTRKEAITSKMSEMVLGRSIFNLPVEEWKCRRRMIAPAFNQKNLQSFFGIFAKHAKQLVENLKCQDIKKPFDVLDNLVKVNIGIILETVLDFDGDVDNPDTENLMHWLEVMQASIINRVTTIWYLSDFIFNMSPAGKELKTVKEQYDAYMNRIIQQWKEGTLKRLTEEQIIDESEKPVKFVEFLLSTSDESGKLTDEELRNEVKTIIITGFETTSATLGYLLLVLGMHPEIQEKLHHEIIDILGPDRELQYDDLKDFEYLERVVKESLRLFPVGIGFLRFCDEELQIEEYTIPAGTTIVVGLLALHRDPKIWPNPTKFDPDRHLPEEVSKRHPYSWLPFNGGARNCVALRFAMQVVKVVIINLIRNFKITTPYKDIDDIHLTWIISFKPKNGYKIALTSRMQA